MTKPIPPEIFNPVAAAKAGMSRLIDWDDRVGSEPWKSGRLWWRVHPRISGGAEEFWRAGLGTVRWYTLYDLERKSDQHDYRRAVAEHVTKALDLARENGHAVGFLPEEGIHADNLQGSMFRWNGHPYYLGHLSEEKVAEALFALLDEDHPVPHPGFRAGQVWAEPWGASWHTRMVTAVQGSRLWTGGREGGESVWQTFSGHAILLYDPLMPKSAPWSP